MLVSHWPFQINVFNFYGYSMLFTFLSLKKKKKKSKDCTFAQNQILYQKFICKFRGLKKKNNLETIWVKKTNKCD